MCEWIFYVINVQNIIMPIADEKEYRDRFLKCPFCLATMKAPRRINTPFGNDVDAGRCYECGSAYVFDSLCKNLGDSYVDAIAYAFDWDYDAIDDDEKTFEDCVVRKHTNGKFLLGDGGKYDKSPKFMFVRRTDRD